MPEEVQPVPAEPIDPMVACVARLYTARILDKTAVSKAVVKFKLNTKQLAGLLGHTSVASFAAELVSEITSTAGDSTDSWVPFSFEEAVMVLYTHRNVAPSELSKQLTGRTAKSVSNYRYRIERQGARVNRAVWELLAEGYSTEEIAAVGHPNWMVEFAQTMKRLETYAIANGHQPPKVVLS